MAVGYKLDASRSRFTVQVFASGMLSAFAHNPTIAIRDFAGTFQLVPESIEKSSFGLTIKADAMEVTDQISEKDRQEIQRIMQQDVMEMQRYPEVKFASTSLTANKVVENWYRIMLTGKLLLHGVTKDQVIDAQLRILDENIRLSGDFKLLQSAFQIKPPSAMGRMILAKDELKFAFDIVGQKEPS